MTTVLGQINRIFWRHEGSRVCNFFWHTLSSPASSKRLCGYVMNTLSERCPSMINSGSSAMACVWVGWGGGGVGAGWTMRAARETDRRAHPHSKMMPRKEDGGLDGVCCTEQRGTRRCPKGRRPDGGGAGGTSAHLLARIIYDDVKAVVNDCLFRSGLVVVHRSTQGVALHLLAETNGRRCPASSR